MEDPVHVREVRARSARSETWMAGRAAFHVVYWALLVVSAETYTAGAGPRAPSPFEVRFADLAADDQRLYRAAQEGVTEAERRRSATGRWPSVEELGREGIPPFARDPLDRAGFAWTLARAGTAARYVGTPRAGSGREVMVVQAVEPDPGTAPDPTVVVDEVHHRLGDGTMIHVTVWLGPPLSVPDGAPAPDLGYRQIVGR